MARAEVASASVRSELDQGTGTVDREARVSAVVDRRAGIAARRARAHHRVPADDLRGRDRAGARPSPPIDRRPDAADRGRRRLPRRPPRQAGEEQSRRPRARAAAAERARAHDPGLGARVRPPDAGHQRRRRDRRRRAPPAGQQRRRSDDRHRAARSAHARPPADRRARRRPAAHHLRRRRRRAGDPARRRLARLRDGAQPLRHERRVRGRASARRGARRLALRHRAHGHALRHHRLRRADPRLRLPLAGDARARGRRDLRDRAQAHRHRAQPRPLRAVGLGPRPRPHLLVALDVRDPRAQAARRADELRRGQHLRASG